MNRFNLEFTGAILPDRDPEQVKARFGRFFAIDDPERLERFFSGRTIVLRRNLEREAAAEYFVTLRRLGVEIRLVKVAGDDSAANDSPAIVATATPAGDASPDTGTGHGPAAAEETPRQQALPLDIPPAGESARDGSDAPQQPATTAAPTRKAGPANRRGRQTARQRALEKKARRKQARKAARHATKRTRGAKGPMAPAQVSGHRAEPLAVQENQTRRDAEKREEAKGEAARLRAREAAARQQREVEEAERQRREVEEAQRQEALRQAAAAEAARQQAREAAARQQRVAEAAERQRREAEETQRREALREAAAAEAARLRAREAAARQQQAVEEAERQRREVAEAQRREALREAAARKAAREQRAQTQRSEAEAHREAAEKEAAKQRGRRDADYARRRALQAMEDQAMRRAATALARQPALQPTAKRPGADVSIAPLLRARRPSTAPARTPRRRQPGAPNIYSLRPFRNTPRVRNRATEARRRMGNGIKLAVAALAALLFMGGRFLSLPAPEMLSGASAIAVDAGLRLVMIADDRLLLHDRSGTGTGAIELQTMGLATLQAPIAFEPSGDLLGMGRLTGVPAAAETESLQLVRCALDTPACRPFAPAAAPVQAAALAIHPLTRVVFAADVNSGQLLKFSAGGELQASAPLAMPAQPVLRLDSGLLFMNSSQGPAISVFRYENEAFGRQLDEILVLPPAAAVGEQSLVRDFLLSGGAWWVTLDNPETGSAGVYRFDAQWDFLNQVDLTADGRLGALVAWGDKVLLHDSGQVPVQRFNAQGGGEVPLVSAPLRALVEGQERSARLIGIAWRAGLILCAALALLGLGYAGLQRLRALVYRPRRERGADPLDERADAVEWIDPVSQRNRILRQRTVHYALLALALLLLAVGFGVSTIQLGALLVALSGPAVALALLRRSPVGHIGVLQRELVLADHAGTYHLGSGARIQYRGNLLMIDDVLVFAGNRLLPAFDQAQVASKVNPLVQAGVRVDRKTVLVKLLQSSHPFARGAIAILVALLAAAVLLSLPG
ncbi:MAG: hypothetical protein P8Y92_02440 [Halioglobus sp.]